MPPLLTEPSTIVTAELGLSSVTSAYDGSLYDLLNLLTKSRDSLCANSHSFVAIYFAYIHEIFDPIKFRDEQCKMAR